MRSKKLVTALIALAVALSALMMCASGCTGFEDSMRRGDFEYYISVSGRRAFVCTYYWDLDPENTDIYIPDTVDKATVERVGGYFGTGVPYPFMIVGEGECLTDSYPSGRQYDVPFTRSDLIFTVHIGKYVTDVPCGYQSYEYYVLTNEDGTMSLYRPMLRFECDPENPYMYSRDGVLYFKRDDSPVITDAKQPKPVASYSAVPYSWLTSSSDVSNSDITE